MLFFPVLPQPLEAQVLEGSSSDLSNPSYKLLVRKEPHGEPWQSASTSCRKRLWEQHWCKYNSKFHLSTSAISLNCMQGVAGGMVRVKVHHVLPQGQEESHHHWWCNGNEVREVSWAECCLRKNINEQIIGLINSLINHCINTLCP